MTLNLEWSTGRETNFVSRLDKFKRVQFLQRVVGSTYHSLGYFFQKILAFLSRKNWINKFEITCCVCCLMFYVPLFYYDNARSYCSFAPLNNKTAFRNGLCLKLCLFFVGSNICANTYKTRVNFYVKEMSWCVNEAITYSLPGFFIGWFPRWYLTTEVTSSRAISHALKSYYLRKQNFRRGRSAGSF